MGIKSSKSDDSKRSRDIATAPLFPDFDFTPGGKVRRYKRIERNIWTENKAQFIRQYLAYFVQVTKHGAYIDGFAGPQSYDHLDAWTAALVLKNEPRWLRHFFLCEIEQRGAKALRELATAEKDVRDTKGKRISRHIEVLEGNFNTEVNHILTSGRITQKEATFCLLDQRTFECHWSTLEKLAAYKVSGLNKIELLYFLGIGWIHRVLSGIREDDKILKWWGQPDWQKLKAMRAYDIADLVRKRFHDELGYRHVAAYPIFDRNGSDKVMYYMIHASDHEEAPALMVRAHHKAVRGLPKEIQKPLFDHSCEK